MRGSLLGFLLLDFLGLSSFSLSFAPYLPDEVVLAAISTATSVPVLCEQDLHLYTLQVLGTGAFLHCSCWPWVSVEGGPCRAVVDE